MLVISRQRDEHVEIGARDQIIIALTKTQLAALQALAKSQNQSLLANRALFDHLQAARPGPVKVMVVDIMGDKTRLGIDAPRSMEIYRSEVADERGQGRFKRRPPAPTPANTETQRSEDDGGYVA
jgi:sRNA-binding carbon storage regulator CsrA